MFKTEHNLENRQKMVRTKLKRLLQEPPMQDKILDKKLGKILPTKYLQSCFKTKNNGLKLNAHVIFFNKKQT